MAFTKIFGTTAGAYSDDTKWKPNDLTTPLFSWTASGSGTNEYYVRTAANGNPGFVASPPTSNGVYINGSAATKATLGSLAAGQWGYGDNDSLGYSTVYVRLSDGTDPDTKDPGYVKFYQMPQAGEDVVFASDSSSINSATGLDQSGVAINKFIVEEGYQGTIGSSTLGYLFIDPDDFQFAGSGEAWINIMAAAIAPRIYNTAPAQVGQRGLYLRGTAITTLDVMGGQVGFAYNAGETSTATTCRVMATGASLWLGSGVSLTNLHVYAGSALVRCAVTTTIEYGGTITTEGSGAMTTVTQKSGDYIFNSSGTITTHHLYGGRFDEMQSGVARTVSTRNAYSGTATINRNKEAVTVTTFTENDSYTASISPGGGGGSTGFIG